MQTTSKVNAVLLAGDRRASIALHNENKAFLNLRGKPLFIHVLEALLRAEHVGEVVIVGPRERLIQSLEIFGISEDVAVVEQRENMIENFKVGYVCSLGLDETQEFWNLKGSGYESTPVLVVPCDIPMLLAEEVDEFLNRANMHEYDYSIGVTSKKILRYYHPHGDTPGIRMIYFHVKEDLMRHNNLHVAKPLMLDHLDYIEKMYEWRYQTRLANIVRVFFSALTHGFRFAKGLRVFIVMQLSLYYDRHGHPKLADRIRSIAGFNRLSEGIGNVLGARVQVVYTHFGGAALDADNEKDLAVMDRRFDEWINYQKNLYS
ncbi:nucleotidyltransferase family protein [Pontiella agarivorans]|uniref:Nucleotidyltransferase family protein n=1 Tax=Pontiella agarivorans TaxID=3038953 RepID=A0ABU5N0V5_9BACT|nr:nucleotidyltransferase family protein [Pontiella agarivorans]MDZ8120089.1 nucleotidyltransferase family protein [Pontiella agarivorans]